MDIQKLLDQLGRIKTDHLYTRSNMSDATESRIANYIAEQEQQLKKGLEDDRELALLEEMRAALPFLKFWSEYFVTALKNNTKFNKSQYQTALQIIEDFKQFDGWGFALNAMCVKEAKQIESAKKYAQLLSRPYVPNSRQKIVLEFHELYTLLNGQIISFIEVHKKPLKKHGFNLAFSNLTLSMALKSVRESEARGIQLPLG